MADKPKRASEYRSEQVALVRSTCLYVATKLGELTARRPRRRLFDVHHTDLGGQVSERQLGEHLSKYADRVAGSLPCAHVGQMRLCTSAELGVKIVDQVFRQYRLDRHRGTACHVDPEIGEADQTSRQTEAGFRRLSKASIHDEYILVGEQVVHLYADARLSVADAIERKWRKSRHRLDDQGFQGSRDKSRNSLVA